MSKFLFFLFLAFPAFAEVTVAPELEVVGKRLHSDHRSARVFTETDLARESGRTVGEILRESAGVDFTNGTGGNSNLLIRGASGSQTLVLIDGVKANDPSATNRYFDWSRIDVSEIERVEILKGPQAVSYGSDAIGGVVLITTKQIGTLGDGVSSVASLEAGSESFVRARAAAASSIGSFFGGEHSLGIEALAKGFFDAKSSALSRTGASLEGDPSREASAGLSLRSRWGDSTRSSLKANLRAAKEEIDAGAFDDDPNSTARNREIRVAATVDGKLSDRLEWGALASHLDFRRAYADFPDTMHATASDTVLNGTNSRAEFHLRSETESGLEWTAGLEGTRETLRIDSLLFPTPLTRDHAETAGVFAESAVPLSKVFTLDLGGRVSSFSTYGQQLSEKAGLTLRPSDALEIDAGVSTGFKAPSLYSLYDPTYGNPGLKPEESTQVEAGASFRGERGSSISIRGFSSWIRNRFGYDPSTFRSLNVARAEIRGIELEAQETITPEVRLAPSLTYLLTKDFRSGLALTDVPRWKGALKIIVDFSRAHSATLSLLGKTSRGTSVGGGEVPGFFRADLSTRHLLAKHWTAFTRFENLLDRDYQEVRGYRSPGLSAFVGAEFNSL